MKHMSAPVFIESPSLQFQLSSTSESNRINDSLNQSIPEIMQSSFAVSTALIVFVPVLAKAYFERSFEASSSSNEFLTFFVIKDLSSI